MCPKYFGGKYCRSWAKNPNFLGGSKTFGTHLSDDHRGTLYTSGHGTHLAKKANIWPKMTKMPILGHIWPFVGTKVKFWPSAKIGPYLKRVLNGTFWPKKTIVCLCNPIFVYGAFVSLCRTTILSVGPIIFLFPIWARECVFLKIFTRPHCGTLSVVNSGLDEIWMSWILVLDIDNLSKVADMFFIQLSNAMERLCIYVSNIIWA